MDIQITAVSKIIEGAMEGDMAKVKAYAKHIAEQLENQGELRAAKIIYNRLNGSYKNESKVILD